MKINNLSEKSTINGLKMIHREYDSNELTKKMYINNSKKDNNPRNQLHA